MLKPGDVLSLHIEKPAVGGRMIARDHGLVVLVSGAIPGEAVRVSVERSGKGVAYARTIAIEDASPDRREPDGDPACGGCLYAHIAYDRQLTLKSEALKDAFARIGRIELGMPIDVVPSRENGHRMRARLHISDGRVGFFREGTHEICDARQTRQLREDTMDALDRCVAALRSLGVDAVREIDLSENIDASERVVHFGLVEGQAKALERAATVEGLTPGPYVTDTLTIDDHPIRLRRHVLAFFQGNRYLTAALVRYVVDRVPIGAALVDLYAGSGLFSIAATVARGARAVAIEGDPYAAADLQANAASAGGQLTTIRGSIENYVNGFAAAADGRLWPETVIVDPPRTGMSREALDGLSRLGARRIVYVSCDVATLARDARRLADAQYTVSDVAAFDMFPNTPHLETVVTFET